MNRLMDTRFELQHEWLQSYNEVVFFLFQVTLLCINGSRVSARSLRQHGQENQLSDNYTATIYVYCNNRRRNCGCQCEIKLGHETAISKNNIVMHSFKFPQRPEQLLQDCIVICWLYMAVYWCQRRKDFIPKLEVCGAT